jgi:transcriptional regulator with XRE-family HTH domain
MPNHLTPAERLWLWRRANGFNQAQAAARMGCGRGLLSLAERGLGPLPRGWGDWRGPVAPALRLALARRRSGWALLRVAARLGVSGVTLLAMERRADPALVKFWQGFTFARARRTI